MTTRGQPATGLLSALLLVFTLAACGRGDGGAERDAAVDGERASRTLGTDDGDAARAGALDPAAGAAHDLDPDRPVSSPPGEDPADDAARSGSAGAGAPGGGASGDVSPGSRGREGAGESASAPRPGSAGTADPNAILARAAAAYAGVRSLRADFVQEARNPILRRTITSRGSLFQRQPDRFLMRFSDPAGDVVVSDGRHVWVYYPSIDERQVIRVPAAQGAGGMDLQAQFLGDPQRRFAAEHRGVEAVRGRATDVLALDPREPVGYRTLVVWVDRSDSLVRRFEIVEENGLVRRFDLHDLEIDPRLSDELFRFTPPADARIVDRG